MTEIKFRSDMTVDLVDFMGGDGRVVQAAKVSTLGSDSLDAKGSQGFIDFLAKNRHGSPFESSVFQFYVEAPIFVVREMQRHRIASWNEESARYKELDPVFYRPRGGRPIVQVGKPGEYQFVAGDPLQHQRVGDHNEHVTTVAYESYKMQLDMGIAREVARMILPLNIYTSLYMTVNARSLMNFLSLRTIREGTQFPSYPQHEIQMVGDRMDEFFAAKMPLTSEAFNKFGRVAP